MALDQQNVMVIFQVDDASPQVGARMAEAVEKMLDESGVTGRVLFYQQNSVNLEDMADSPPTGFGGPMMVPPWSN